MQTHAVDFDNPSEISTLTHLALKRFHGQMDDHVRFKRLFLHKGLEADVALEGPHAGVDQHVSLQVG